MIDRQALLADLQALLKRLEADLLERSDSTAIPAVGESLREEYERAKKAERTAQNYEDWRNDAITQAAAAWVLSCVFVRFLEDNELIDPPKLSGPASRGREPAEENRLQRARDEHTLYFQDRERAKLTDREYLLSVFDALAKLPGTKDVFGEHNPVRELPNWLSGDAAGELLRFFQKIDAGTGELIHDFTDAEWDTRFLGDLYQDLSEAARKKYALLQTPEFVEEFILDRTLEPALDEFGLVVIGQNVPNATDNEQLTTDRFRMIDPACGSGHFLLGAFNRILNRWQRKEPDTNVRELVQRTLDAIHGVDVNPFAVAIARFRLLLAALREAGITRLTDAPDFKVHITAGDSLLHGAGEQRSLGWRDVDHATWAEDPDELARILVPGRYHAVVANPPYITPKDRALNQAYRERYSTCHRKYSLAVPFMQRIFQLAVNANGAACGLAGYTGQITANSFMKREFGKKLIEEFFPAADLTHVIDTSGTYIPGHGTPTVILFGRNRAPVNGTIRTVMGIRGEPSTPADPSRGQVWSAIVDQIDRPGSESEFVSAGDSARDRFHTHPWSIGGGGAAELKKQLEASVSTRLGEIAAAIGITAVTGEDELFMQPQSMLQRLKIEKIRPLVEGDVVRDWMINNPMSSVWLYDDDFELLPLRELPQTERLWWTFRAAIYWRKRFGTPLVERGLTWYEWQELYKDKLRTPLSIVFAFVATHNHFVLDRGGKVFKQSAPVIKLPPEATEDDHLALLGLLNSSTACFWFQQTMHNKGGPGGASSKDEKWHDFFEFSGTRMDDFPLPESRPLELARQLDGMAGLLADLAPGVLLKAGPAEHHPEILAERRFQWEALRQQMIALQEELDWECYRLYRLLDDDLTAAEPPAIELGQRAFEIVLACRVAAGTVQTKWFQWLNIEPVTKLPEDWPQDYKKLVERRIELIESDKNIGLIEQTNTKRRWETEPWDSQLDRALREWLLDRLESYFDFDGRMNDEGKATAKIDISLTSIAKLADIARADQQFQEVGSVYRDDDAFDVQRLVEELVKGEHVPLLPVLRYKPAGLRKRAEWEKTWDLQRREDAGPVDGNIVGDIPVPPKYKSSDFISTGGARYWALRGKLDVPKERWVSFPHCEGPDGTLVIAWAGYDHLGLARAISAYFVDVQERLGGRDDPRLVPLLAGVIELLPWIKQWHNQPSTEYDGLRMGDYFEGFITEEAKNLGKTVDEVKAWTPPARTGARRRNRASRT